MTLLTRLALVNIIHRRKEKAFNGPKSRVKYRRINRAFSTTQKSLLEELAVKAARREGVDVEELRRTAENLTRKTGKLIQLPASWVGRSSDGNPGGAA